MAALEETSVRQAPGRRETVGLATLFGVMYFVQGIGEPTEGLISQPVRSLLKDWGRSAAEIAAFSAVLGLPWTLKPLYGLLTDFVPLGGTRRRGWLLLMTAATIIGLGGLWLFPVAPGADGLLLAWLLVPAVGIAFTDVVVDALMVEKGQPRGLTGLFQSVQWAAIYGATILTGVVGGYLSEHRMQTTGFAIAAGFTLVSLIVAVIYVTEGRRARPGTVAREIEELVDAPASPNPGALRQRTGRGLALKRALAALWKTARSPAVLYTGGFLFLWNFNPFSSALLQFHMTERLGYSEQFYGNTASMLAVGALLGSVAYGFYCRAVQFPHLLHLSIVAGVYATIAYWQLERDSPAVAYGISALAGFTWMTGSLVQLDLAARTCPPETAGTTFALLMAVSNLAMSVSQWVGGLLYERWTAVWYPEFAFTLLVGTGALCTAGCWVLVPFLKRYAREADSRKAL
ncbi:MAG TPA: MFS transporter [Planctomycetaceae bacterium]|nr:MFS transporter [Planctomycetaceae bacterium]